ncbi:MULTISPECIES: ABC transporter permease [unclassified Herbaspirillum]|uniref:ABC transporter permease n=1 Tax=unclassified Herbaspirillum TaxID=2624150 RepID=UPI0011500EB5|nr:MULTISPECIES: ABC transporter permease [unclassified Herbaspirillum]MBB5391294.1 simple sugar transport system permease protein [Herbaspirillum sp. SJZ102]TQK13019.1 nucleoside ABC transporter membrane protein [Herbaspirillum sp. SJZ130]TQK15023.1 nucleoside ABC transporter membrane protein [Herbaspirillum sp. SJZ106]
MTPANPLLQQQLQRQALAQRWRLPLALLASLAVGFIITLAVSDQPLRAFLMLLTGPMPRLDWSAADGWQLTRMVRFGAVIEDAITLCLLGLAVSLPFRARQFSLGADGQLFLGALAATAASLWWPGPWYAALPLAFAAACITGFAWGAVPGLLKVRFDINEIVSTLMLNIIAVQFYRWVVTDILRDPAAGFIVTPMLAPGLQLPVLLAHTNVTVMLLALPAMVWLAWVLLMRTTLGYEIRVVGEAPAFARQAGLPVQRTIWLSMALGGAFAALAGVHVSHGLLKRLPVDLPTGLGYEGLLVALLARNNPRVVPLAALLYAWLRTGALAMERSTDVSREMVLVIQALMILFVVSERMGPALAGLWLDWRARRGGRHGA